MHRRRRLALAARSAQSSSAPRAQDARIKPAYLERNVGIAAATNAALELASGEFVAFLDHDDVLSSDALLRVVEVARRGPRARRRLLRLGQADRRTGSAPTRSSSRTGRRSTRSARCTSATCWSSAARSPSASAASIPPTTRSRTSSSCCACRSDTERIHHMPRDPLPLAGDPGQHRRRHRPEGRASRSCRRERSAPTCERIGAAARAVPHPRDPPPGPARPDPRRDRAAGRARREVERRDRRLARRPTALDRLLASLLDVGARPPGEVIVVGADAAEVPSARPAAARSRVVADGGPVQPARARATAPPRRRAASGWLLSATPPRWSSRTGSRSCALHAALPRRRSPLGRCSRAPTGGGGGRVRDRSRPPGRADARRARRRTPTATTARWSARATSRRSATSSCCSAAPRSSRAGGFEENYADRLRGLRPLPAAARRGRRGRLRGPPADRRPRDPRRAARGARHRRPGAVRRSLVRPRSPSGDPFFNPNFARADAELRDRRHERALEAAPEPMRLVIVYFGPFHVNSAIQAFHFARRPDRRRAGTVTLAGGRRPGSGSARSASRTSSASRTTTSPVCSSAAGAPDEPTIVLAWTPREIVRDATEDFAAGSAPRTSIHLEDNEWHLYGEAVRTPIEQVAPPLARRAGSDQPRRP